MSVYNFTKEINSDRLTQEIQQSSISTALDHIETSGDSVDIYFKHDLSEVEQAILESIVTNHVNTSITPDPIPVNTGFPTDTDGKPVFRQSVTSVGWFYSPRSLDFWTSTYNSLYNKKDDGNLIDDGTDYNDGWMKFFDSNGAEIVKGESESIEAFQLRIDGSCVKTICYFENKKSYDVFGANVMVKNPPTDRTYLWMVAAPHIPEIYGGNFPFMGGGINLSFFPNCSAVRFDAKTSKTIQYDSEYHSGLIAIVVKHAIGAKIGIQIIFEFFVAG